MIKLISLHFVSLVVIACSIVISLTSLSEVSYARDYFNPEFLGVDNPGLRGVDLSSFETGSQAAGKYLVDIIINDHTFDTRDVEFKLKDSIGEATLEPCLSLELLKSYGLKTDHLPPIKNNDGCVDFSSIPSANYKFVFNTQKLIINIPQAYVSQTARGYVPPERWDEGINAALLNYSISGDKAWAGSNTNSEYVNLRPGLNFGAWRLRNYSTWNRDSDGTNTWDSIYTYAQRNVVSLKSQLTLGDSSTRSDVFEALPFRGGQLASDDDMLPDSLRGYAPVVRGIARTNAQVSIRQNGYVIYQNYVAAGAFEITDMFPTGGSGDLDVTVKEADGSEQHFVVPFASLPVLQREGHLKFAITGGQYRSYNSQVDKTPLVQGTAIYGLPYGLTLYGGIQGSNPYRALAAGVGKNMGGFGAFSTDLIQASSEMEDKSKSQGQSWRIRYNKNFVNTGTNFAVASYRYSTDGYYNMQDVLDSYDGTNVFPARRQNRFELTASQTLWDCWGALSLSVIKENYWGKSKATQSYSTGYNNSWQGISWGMNFTWNKNNDPQDSDSKTLDDDKIFALNVSIPLDRLISNTWASYSLNTSKQGNTINTAGINGVALQNNALSWNAQEGYGTGGQGMLGNLSSTYKGTYGELNSGYSYDQNSKRINYGLAGGILVHDEGITLAQSLGETISLVKAPGVQGVSVEGQQGVKTDWRGYTIATNLTPYRENTLALDTATLADDVELELTSQTVVPTRGSVVKAEYKANIGNRALITLKLANGETVPFGATARLSDTPTSAEFIVGDNGQVYLSGLPDQFGINAKWGEDADKQCKSLISLPVKSSQKITQLDAICQS